MKRTQPRVKLDFSYVGTLGLTFQCEALVSYTPADPGVTSGPPERCYPPEPAEVQQVISARLVEVNENPVDIRLRPGDLDDEFMDALHEALNESPESSDPDDGSDRAYEEARDRELERQWEMEQERKGK